MTSAQQNFARLVAGGASYAEAYRSAYPRSRKWTPEAVAVEASRLAASPNVSPMIEELRRAADAEAIMGCRELRTILTARVRFLAEMHGPTAELCRAADTLARVSGWHSPEALAVAVSGVALAPGDRGRHICDLLGVSFDLVRKGNYDEAWRLFREAMGVPEISPEERARRINDLLGIPNTRPERVSPEDATLAPSPVALPSLPAPSPETIEPPATRPAEVAEIAEDGDAADAEREPVDGRAEDETPEPEPEPVPAAVEAEAVPVEETPERRERLARILAFVKRHGATTRAEARALALTFEGGSVIGSEATAVADAWEAEQQTGGDND